MSEGSKEFDKRELSGAEQIQGLRNRGFNVTSIFQPEQNADFEAYLEALKTQGKKPHEDFAFVIDKDLEGTTDLETGKVRQRVIKVLEK